MKTLLHWIVILGIAYASQEDQIPFTNSASSSNEMVAFKIFDGSNESYLSLQVGDEIQLLSPPEDGQGWSYGKSKRTNRIGWFPPRFVIPRISARRVFSDWEPTPDLGEEYIPLQKDDLILQLPTPEQDHGWAYGQLNTGREGWFPPGFIKPFSNEPSVANFFLEEGIKKADDCYDHRLMKRCFNTWHGSRAYNDLQREITEMADEDIQNQPSGANSWLEEGTSKIANQKITEMTDEDIHNLARKATEHHKAEMLSNFEQQNDHPLGGYPLQYMGWPQDTYVDFYMFQPSQYMQHWHPQDASPGRHITQRYSSRQTHCTHDGRLSSGSNQEEMSTETRFYKSKVPREGDYTVITAVTGNKVTFRVPKNDSNVPGGWGGWFPAHKGEIKNDFGVNVFEHWTVRGRRDQWEFDYVGKNIVFRGSKRQRPTWINITGAEYQKILKDGKQKAIPWIEELTDEADDESK